MNIQKKRNQKSKETRPFSNLSDYRYLITLILPLLLSGCMGVYEGGFECPPGEGVGCKSISDVNEMINQEEIPKSSSTVSSKKKCKNCHSSDQDSSESDFSPTDVSEADLSETEKNELQIWTAPGAFGDSPQVDHPLEDSPHMDYPLLEA